MGVKKELKKSGDKVKTRNVQTDLILERIKSDFV